ncbi:MAG: LacI family DNA-binding transcriptional regulator [Verrucomicrobia bacterium]|nr:LacI family DNA-binding transcriptional regulator [Verrucomicrobiota bacterium]
MSKAPGPISGVELARRLGLSHATVSYVLNGQGEKKKIAPATIKRVQDEAKRLNYAPMPFARSLLSRRSGMISVIFGNFKMDWAESAVQGLNRVFDPTDYVAFVATHGFNEERNQRELHSFLRRRDNGLITMPTMGCTNFYRDIARSDTPLVFLGDQIPELANLVSSVMWDPSVAIGSAVSHLVGSGRRRIAFLSIDYPGVGTLHRFKAFQSALATHHLHATREMVSTPPVSQEPEQIVNAALDQFFSGRTAPPDAIFALNDGLALPALEALDRRGLRVPEDVALVGMGDLPMTSHSAIGLSTIPEPTAEMAAMAARLLLDLMEGRQKTPVNKTLPTSEFIARRTTLGQSRKAPA